MYASKQEFKLALADLSEAIKHDPNFVEALLNRGKVYTKLGGIDDAIFDFTKIMK